MKIAIKVFILCVIINSSSFNSQLLAQEPEVLAQEPEVYFLSQSGNRKIVELCDEARHSIRIVAYALTNSNIADAIIQASRRGIDIELILDADQFYNNRFSLGSKFQKYKIDVKLIDSNKWRLINDFGVIDERVLYVGGALLHTEIEKNPKLGNFLVFMNTTDLVDQYLNNFYWIYNSDFVKESIW